MRAIVNGKLVDLPKGATVEELRKSYQILVKMTLWKKVSVVLVL